MRRNVRFAAGVLCCAVAAFAAEPELEKTEAAPPESAPAEIREAVGDGSLKVVLGEGKVVELWLREDLPLREGGSADLGVSFGEIEEGTLVGLASLTAEWLDYKNNPIPPGDYTLRYGIQPADGNHMGVSLYRDFLILIPVAQENALETGWTHDELILQSFGATAKNHPAILGLFPVYEEIDEPRLVTNDLDQPMVAVRAGKLTLGLVVEGHGELEGY